ncbi:hypothetical protein N7519_009475 [Penicillium mononematosum]|uniref:uncharacterized protein n=1 Tax=Penicillium mononematosum TaxID=268346 RepID=UPI00254961C4|nr:uncharacterized protein N7519_009475 [Penicillium mononematosum]KAJ6179014.1 hypothetical protein N7519_009475 [Penicillium mononematosum]
MVPAHNRESDHATQTKEAKHHGYFTTEKLTETANAQQKPSHNRALGERQRRTDFGVEGEVPSEEAVDSDGKDPMEVMLDQRRTGPFWRRKDKLRHISMDNAKFYD